MSSFNNVYFDQLYIENGRETTGNNFISSVSDRNTNIPQFGGYRWVIQLVNKGSSSFTFNSNTKLRIGSLYKNNTGTGSGFSLLDTDITLTGSIAGNNGSYYIASTVGTSILPSGISANISVANLFPTYYNISGVNYAAVQIGLLNSGVFTDLLSTPVSNSFLNDIQGGVIQSYIDPDAQANNTFSIYRRSSGTPPTTDLNFRNTFSVVQPITTNTLDGSRLNASFTGDPHVTTVYGITYKFDYLGAFRLYEDDNIIINGLSERGDKKRWSSRQYVRKIFIQSKNKEILIDLGFRGSKAKVLENNGFEVTEEELEFSNEAKVHSWDCKKEFAIHDLEGIKEHRKNHKILDPVRNKLNINIEGYKIFVENINEFNLQPCRLFFDRIDSNYTNAVGCVIDRKYVGVSLLDDIKNTESVKNIKENLELVYKYTELESAPEKINIKYV